MKLIIAPDKFKNSLTGLQFCNAVEAGIKAVKPNIDILKLPLADGGDGTYDVINYYLQGEVVEVHVNDPFFRPVKASYVFDEVLKTAFIEMAEASGLKLLKDKEFDCKNATTIGTGEMIVHAIEKGAETIVLGLGGSATNDCGVGMATALGYHFLDKQNNQVHPVGANLLNIETIDISQIHPKLDKVSFKIACDVTNPLYGKNGAAYTYGTQKGANTDDIVMLDNGLQHISKLLEKVFKVNPQLVKGAGAAGGMGIASKLFLGGNLFSGIELIKDLIDFDTKIENANWLITGEGKLDVQTQSGKTIQGVLISSQAKKIKVAVFCGIIDLDENALRDSGIQYADAVINYAQDLDDAKANAFLYVKNMAEKFAKKQL
ncbi:glycerate kinase [uncultured Algibacter sp.]|uniref:glycerate kinase n=1 Tax=uncultured Algibacter sp. TaxID=298659 RepID=UPI00260F3A3B|nr:glycerate kinase [uncultured Algibacter sp.]